jgi:hypothetical protein
MQFTQSKLQILPELQLKRVLKRKNYIMDTNRLCENLTDTDTIPSTARNCRSLYDIRFLNESEYRGIYLVYSYPGSGNTWVRLLMEELSGIFTGSSYHDSKILDTGMLGEGQKLEHVIAVKYHHLYNEPLMDVIIAIVRNPFHALLSRLAFQTTKAHDISFAADSLANSSFAKLLHSWEQTHVWLRRKDLTIHVLQYDKLVSEFEEEVRKLVSFLNFPISEESIDCVVRANANMTLFRRNRKQVEKSPFSEEQEEAIYKTIYSLEDVWNMYKVDYKKWKW